MLFLVRGDSNAFPFSGFVSVSAAALLRWICSLFFQKTSRKRKNFGRLLKTERLNMMLNIIYLLEYWKALNIFRIIEFIWNICEFFNSFEAFQKLFWYASLAWPCSVIRYYYLWSVFAFYISFWLILVKFIEIGYLSSR